MKKASSVLIALVLCLGVLRGETGDSAIDFHTPVSWRGETIQLPPGFAPDLNWHGVEHIRFAPGMFEADSESFFSYLLVFLLKEGDDVSESSVREQILIYYRGLARAVMAGRNLDVDTSTFTLELGPLDRPGAFVPAAAEEKVVKTWRGTLNWVEPFATRKEQRLTIEIHLWEGATGPIVYFTVSPQGEDHAIWKELRKYRALFEIN